ncbi:MAG: BsuBI/PstI family type II restriction endonuclease [Nitrososphaeraceae archaeon]
MVDTNILQNQKIQEALNIIKELGFPKRQQNKRSALTLLALLNLKPSQKWSEVTNPLCGIKPMMLFFHKYYNEKYAENTRESVRRQTIHQFLQANLIEINPDKPDRPTNSGHTVYRIKNNAINVIKTFSTKNWESNLFKYKKKTPPLSETYSQRRHKHLISVEYENKIITLTPGGQNKLVKLIISEFKRNFAPNSEIIYLGDTGKKTPIHRKEVFRELGIEINPHGKIPDVIMYDREKKWIFLIEAVTSHGPIDSKRKIELEPIFSKPSIGIIYVTTFIDKKSMMKYIKDISWKTEVWIAEDPEHLIHFDGERFLGPYL